MNSHCCPERATIERSSVPAADQLITRITLSISDLVLLLVNNEVLSSVMVHQHRWIEPLA